MEDQRHAAMTDEALEREIANALDVDPAPDFLARVRTAVASEPVPLSAIAALTGCATSRKWRRAFLARRSAWGAKTVALRWPLSVGGAAAAAAIVVAVVMMRLDGAPAPVRGSALAAQPLGQTIVVPYVVSGFLTAEASATAVSRTYDAQTVQSARRSVGPPEGGPHVQVLFDPRGPHVLIPAGPHVLPVPLFDPRETRALRSLIAGVRDSRVDLAPLLRPGAPAPMELPPVDDLVIAPITIEPIAPWTGAQGERQ